MNFDKLINNIAEISEYFWQKGWAERNAGNISVDVSRWADNFEEIPVKIPLKNTYENLSGKCFLITATGSRMRNLCKNPYENILIIKISDDGKYYNKMVGNKNFDIKNEPSSELPTHLAVHSHIAEKGGKETVVLHVHVTELIALTQIKEFCDEERLNLLLWSMHPETVMFIPEGIGFVPYTTPGTDNLAAKTVEALQQHKIAVWEKHGVIATGSTIDEAFDSIDISAKAAKIFFLVKNAGFSPEGISTKELEKLRNVTR